MNRYPETNPPERDQLIGALMPERGHGTIIVDEPAPVNHIRFVLHDRLQEQTQIARIVLHVRVLDHHDVSLRRCQSRLDRSPFPLIDIVQNDPTVLSCATRCSTSRVPSVLPSSTRMISSGNSVHAPRNHLLDRLRFVVHGNHHRQAETLLPDGRCPTDDIRRAPSTRCSNSTRCADVTAPLPHRSCSNTCGRAVARTLVLGRLTRLSCGVAEFTGYLSIATTSRGTHGTSTQQRPAARPMTRID